MPLLFAESGLVKTDRVDPEMRQLADRHYSRETHGHREFLGPARTLVLRDAPGTILFAWMWPQDGMRLDGQTGYNCAIFRNESERRASEVILEAEAMALDYWGPNRMYTYVDPRKVGSPNPGYCFKRAGWRFVRVTRKGLHLLEKPCPI